MAWWAKQHAVDYIFGLARNQRLRRKIAKEMRPAQKEQQRTNGTRSRVDRVLLSDAQDLEQETLDRCRGRADSRQGESPLRGDVIFPSLPGLCL